MSVINGQVYRDEACPRWCLCDECVAADQSGVKAAFVTSYQNTFGPDDDDDVIVLE